MKKHKARRTNAPENVFRYVDIQHDENKAINKLVCWPWKGATQAKNGERRGMFSIEGKTYYATRVVYETYYGKKLEKFEVVRHTCDNSLCCNPFHLLSGTQKDNARDRSERERQGMKHIHVKKIMHLLEVGCTSYYVQTYMQKEYKLFVDPSVIRRIKRREVYKVVEWPWGDEWATNNPRKGTRSKTKETEDDTKSD
jgi:hypothetical protein